MEKLKKDDGQILVNSRSIMDRFTPKRILHDF